MDRIISYAVAGWFMVSLVAGQLVILGIGALVFLGTFRRPLFSHRKNRK